MRFTGQIKNGQLLLDDRPRFKELMSKWDGKRIHLAVSQKHPLRSNDANKRYWYLLQAGADYTGHDPEELHDYFKEKHLLPREEPLPSGQPIVWRPSTAALDQKDFSNYVDKVERDLAQIGVEFQFYDR